MNLEDILSTLRDMEPRDADDWINQMIGQQERLKIKRRRAAEALRREAEREPYGPTHYGALGAEREG